MGSICSAGQYTELVDLYHSEEILQATRAMNLGLMSLPVRDVPYFYKAIAEGLNIQPNAMSVALLIRSLGKLNRVSDAEAIWHDCQVILTYLAMHAKVHCIHRMNTLVKEKNAFNNSIGSLNRVL